MPETTIRGPFQTLGIFPAGTPGISGVNVLNSWSVRIRYGKPYEVSP